MNHKLNKYNRCEYKVEEDKIIIDLHKVISLELAEWRKIDVTETFNRLNVTVSKEVRQFYISFRGPFGQRPFGGITLLDVIRDDPNIESLTKICREEFKFPNQYLVMTNYNDVGEIIVLDTLSDKLYTVCIECGEDEELLEGKLKPKWQSFNEFLTEFFDLH